MGDSQRFDLIIRIVIAVLLVAIVGLGAYFGWTVRRDRIAIEGATPALRVVRALEGQVRGKPNDALLRVRLGEAYAAAGRDQDAIKQFNSALKIEPKHTGALLNLGQVAMRNMRLADAEGYFKKVLEATSGSEFEAVSDRAEIALYQLGLIALQEKRYEDAIGRFKAALRIRKDASDTYYYLGLALDGVGETEGAIKQLQIAVAFDPNFGQAHYYLGQLFTRQGDDLKASEHYGRATMADPDAEEPKQALKRFGDPVELIAKSRTLRERDIDAALEMATIARNIAPRNLEAAINYAETLEASGNAKGALEAYRSTLSLAPKDKRITSAIERLVKATAKKK